MAKLTSNQLSIAANMLENGRFSIGNDSTADDVEAAAFLFDNGILYAPRSAVPELVAMLRDKAATPPEAKP